MKIQAKMRFMKKVLIGCFLILLIFTGVALVANFRGIDIADSLIYSFFAAFGIETAVSAVIKINENKEANNYANSAADHSDADE